MSDNHFYYNVMRKIIVQTLDIFNNISIAKYDNSGEIGEYIKVPLQFAPKTKQWYFQQANRQKDGLTITDLIFPVMAMQMTGMDFAKDRVVNNLQKVIINHNTNDLSYHLTPIPYNYQFTLEIVAEHFIDILQIVEQILPWFNPHITIRISINDLNIRTPLNKDDFNEDGSTALELRVIYNGTTVEAPTEIDISNVRILKWDLTFEVKGFLFQPLKIDPYVKKVITDVYTNHDQFNLSLTQPASGDFMEIISNTTFKKYDEDARIIYEYESINNV